MKIALILFALSASFAQAEILQVGCAVGNQVCGTPPGKSESCTWSYDVGRVLDLDVKKTGDAPGYTIWEGSIDGVTRSIPIHVSVYQRREPKQNFNYLTVELKPKDMLVSSTGLSVSEARVVDKAKNINIGVHCTSDISPNIQ